MFRWIKLKSILGVIKKAEQTITIVTFGRVRPQLRFLFIMWMINKYLPKLGKDKIDVDLR
jgi:hypothetical protein